MSNKRWSPQCMAIPGESVWVPRAKSAPLPPKKCRGHEFTRMKRPSQSRGECCGPGDGGEKRPQLPLGATTQSFLLTLHQKLEAWGSG